MGEGGGLSPWGLITGCIVLFTGKWACNWGPYKWGEVGAYIQRAYKGLYFFCVQVNGPVTGGRWGNFSEGGS